ncbi:methionine adenosyltransferase [Myceligenerans crystallogenes]|uniref:Methionine adenosyltransferase n=1 Tax=Myceligenerans crystallogenes TaxID=316335 RepID=A0ABN2N9H2_9MICO
MHVTVENRSVTPAHEAEFEVVERKGIGHPDSMADILAEEFSRRYSRYGLDTLGIVPNHWVDKVALIGAAATVDFGGFSVDKPISSYLFGKLTRAIGDTSMPIEDLFRNASTDVLVAATRDPRIIDYVRHAVENTSGTAVDHPPAFYRPIDAVAAEQATALRANDTAFCAAHAPATPTEQLAITLENLVNGPEFATMFPAAGSDVKVMLLRGDARLDVTLCLPFHPGMTPTGESYRGMLAAAHEHIAALAAVAALGLGISDPVHVAVNTKDVEGGAYLAPFGTSLGKGDCGLVGRGNKADGVIASSRSAGVEALAGKNPVHHTGKLYTLAATRIADRVHAELGLANETVLMSRNGDPLDQPAFVGVRLGGRAGRAQRVVIDEIAHDTISRLDLLTKWLLETPAIERFRDPRVQVEG